MFHNLHIIIILMIDLFFHLISNRLEEICLACSSDPDTSLTGDEPGLPAQLFNLGLISVGLLAPQVTMCLTFEYMISGSLYEPTNLMVFYRW